MRFFALQMQTTLICPNDGLVIYLVSVIVIQIARKKTNSSVIRLLESWYWQA